MNMDFKREMPTARVIKEMYPLSDRLVETKANNDAEVRQIFLGQSHKFLLVIGPCSADREDAVLEYIGRLREVQDKVQDKIVIVPRIYTNKPRTTGAGYKGMLHQPDPNNSPDLLKGLIAIRKLHVDALEKTGFSCADEMLYPENHRYLSDCLSYVAVGARSVEDQQHRLVASGLAIPVGMKNPTGGDLSVMMNSITAAQNMHTFVFSGWEVQSKGNPLAHAILRGYASKHGRTVPNYHYEDIIRLVHLYNERNLKYPAAVIDTNHSNSDKQHKQQIRIAKEVLHNRYENPEIRTIVKGLMIESYLEEGCQKIGEGVFGKSITDPCLSWEDSERLIYEIAEQV